MSSRLERLSQSHLQVTSIRSEEFTATLAKFSNLFKACAGPQGKNHMVRNNCGGHVTVTGSSSRLLSAMMVSRPELKLLVSSAQAHLDRHSDGGLFLLVLCSSLIQSLPDMHLSTLASLYKTFLSIVVSYLNDPECPVRVPADFSNLTVLLQYVRSVLSSKTLLNLSTSDCDHLSRLIMKTFIDSIPSEALSVPSGVSDRVFCLTLSDSPVSESKLEPGLLLRCPDLPTMFGERTLDIQQTTLPTESACDGEENVSSCVRVCLFACSMSGDMEEVVDCHFELTDGQNAAMEKEVRENLLQVCRVLQEEGVGLLLCQKVIHPTVKADLRSKGIFFVDRLGLQVMPYVQDLTGARPLMSILDIESIGSSLGWVSSVRHVILSEKSFLCLTRPEPAVSTLVLCAPWEERLEELRACVRASLRGLSYLAQRKALLMGGGCWVVNASWKLQEKVMFDLPSLCTSHHCSTSTILTALSAFRGSLHAWLHSLVAHTQENLLVDPTYFHLWRVPSGREATQDDSSIVCCCCGSKSAPKQSLSQFTWLSKTERLSYDQTLLSPAVVCGEDISDTDNDSTAGHDRVLDSLAMYTDALQQAVSTADLLLSIGQFISDRN